MSHDYDVVALEISPALTADELADLANVALTNPRAELVAFSSTWDKDPRDLCRSPRPWPHGRRSAPWPTLSTFAAGSSPNPPASSSYARP